MQTDDIRAALDRVACGQLLSEGEAETAFGLLLDGDTTPAQAAGLLMALRVRGETAGELAGAARAMRRRMRAVTAPADAVDVCGTGGDRHGTLNVSTAVAFVLASLGVVVAKHGNRGQSSRSGASDVLAALGVAAIDDPTVLAQQLSVRGLAFLSAPVHHPALRGLAGLRAELGTRTLFNLLGPLCNPAGVRRQLLGVSQPAWLELAAGALAALGAERFWVVHGENRVGLDDAPGHAHEPAQGIDEMTLAGPSHVIALEAGRLHRFTLSPEQVGLQPAPLAAIAGGEAADNARALEAALRGARGAYRDTILLNAGAALRVARGDNMFAPGTAGLGELRAAIRQAARAIDDGLTWRVLESTRADTRAWSETRVGGSVPGSTREDGEKRG